MDRVAVETDTQMRQALIERASRLLHDEAAFLPLHQQTVVWAAKANIDMQAKPDNFFALRHVTVK